MKKLLFAALPLLICFAASAQTVKIFDNWEIASMLTGGDILRQNVTSAARLATGQENPKLEKGVYYEIYFNAVVRSGTAEVCRTPMLIRAVSVKSGGWEIIADAANGLQGMPSGTYRKTYICATADESAVANGTFSFKAGAAVSNVKIKVPFIIPDFLKAGYTCDFTLNSRQNSSEFKYQCQSSNKNLSLEDFQYFAREK